LHDEIEAGTPMVGLEPSCTAVFRDELTELFPLDEDARQLSKQTFTLAEFLADQDYHPPKLTRKAVAHGHCHHKAIMKMDCDRDLLQKMGLDFEFVDSGCCGMAGAFGFEKNHYDVSMACGERVLLPMVRTAAKDTLIVADGFSCREQIRQATDRKALHLAEIVKMSIEEGPRGPAGNYPESNYVTSRPHVLSIGKAIVTLGLMALAVAALLARFFLLSRLISRNRGSESKRRN
jgi:Fe-S oxidoreductase